MYICECCYEKILFVKTSYINGDYVKHVKKLSKTTLSIGNPTTVFLNVFLIFDFLETFCENSFVSKERGGGVLVGFQNIENHSKRGISKNMFFSNGGFWCFQI